MPHRAIHSPVPDSGTAPVPPRRMRARRWLVPGLLVLTPLWLWLRLDGSEVQHARTRSLLQQADAALARGHLSASDGSSARELYAAAQAIDPDLPEARRGQVQVGLAVLARARQALARGEIPAAQHDLELAGQLQVPRAEWNLVAEALHQHKLEQVDLDVLFERAETARVQGWLSDVPPEFPDQSAALPLYAHILTLAPGHAAVLRGREDALAQLLEQARASLRAGDLETAAAAIATTRVYDPGHIDLPDTLARFTEEHAGVQRQAAAALVQGQLEAAIDGWQRLLALDSNDIEARSGIEHVAQVLVKHATVLSDALQFSEAERTLQRARELSPFSPAIHATGLRIARAQQRQRDDAPSASLQTTGVCFEMSLAANNLGRARECMDAGRALGEDVDTLNVRRRQLALRWIAIGEERLGRGNLPAAIVTLNTAREIDPGTPGLQALAHRLDMAQR